MSERPNGQTQEFAPIDKAVFFGSVGLLIVIVGFAALAPELAGEWFGALQTAIVVNASWFYVAVVAVIVLTCIGIAITKYGDIRLGSDHDEPEYSVISWFAMLFAAGMGIGLMFFGEPRRYRLRRR